MSRRAEFRTDPYGMTIKHMRLELERVHEYAKQLAQQHPFVASAAKECSSESADVEPKVWFQLGEFFRELSNEWRRENKLLTQVNEDAFAHIEKNLSHYVELFQFDVIEESLVGTMKPLLHAMHNALTTAELRSENSLMRKYIAQHRNYLLANADTIPNAREQLLILDSLNVVWNRSTDESNQN